MTAAIRYAAGGAALTADLIYQWDRGDLEPITGSSGLKDYLRNQVWQIFQDHPKIDRVLMMHANGPTFFLLRADTWRDVTGQAVSIEAAA